MILSRQVKKIPANSTGGPVNQEEAGQAQRRMSSSSQSCRQQPAEEFAEEQDEVALRPFAVLQTPLLGLRVWPSGPTTPLVESGLCCAFQ